MLSEQQASAIACDKLGQLTDETQMKLYQVSTLQPDAVYRRYLNHPLNVLQN